MINIENYKERNNSSCGCLFHPHQQQLIGVCPFCLNERLLILASSSTRRSRHGFLHSTFSRNRLPIKKLPKIFAVTSFLNRLDFKHWKTRNSVDLVDVSVSTSSQEDSFISIKFEENGVASWEKGNGKSKVSTEHCTKTWNPTLTKEVPNKSVIEHVKQRASLRWRKRIGQLSQLIKWKRSSKDSVCHMGSKVTGKGWIRSLTKRTKE